MTVEMCSSIIRPLEIFYEPSLHSFPLLVKRGLRFDMSIGGCLGTFCTYIQQAPSQLVQFTFVRISDDSKIA